METKRFIFRGSIAMRDINIMAKPVRLNLVAPGECGEECHYLLQKWLKFRHKQLRMLMSWCFCFGVGLCLFGCLVRDQIMGGSSQDGSKLFLTAMGMVGKSPKGRVDFPTLRGSSSPFESRLGRNTVLPWRLTYLLKWCLVGRWFISF